MSRPPSYRVSLRVVPVSVVPCLGVRTTLRLGPPDSNVDDGSPSKLRLRWTPTRGVVATQHEDRGELLFIPTVYGREQEIGEGTTVRGEGVKTRPRRLKKLGFTPSICSETIDLQ